MNTSNNHFQFSWIHLFTRKNIFKKYRKKIIKKTVESVMFASDFFALGPYRLVIRLKAAERQPNLMIWLVIIMGLSKNSGDHK